MNKKTRTPCINDTWCFFCAKYFFSITKEKIPLKTLCKHSTMKNK